MSLSLPISVNKLLNGAHRWANITAPWNTEWEQLFQIGGFIRKKGLREKEDIQETGHGRGEPGCRDEAQDREKAVLSILCIFLPLLLKPLPVPDSEQVLLGSKLSQRMHRKDSSIFPRRGC